MNKFKDNLLLAIKGALFIYMPLVLVLFIFYNVILKTEIEFSLSKILFYSFIIGIGTISNYAHIKTEEKFLDISSLKNAIKNKSWETIEQKENSLIVKPKFDFPFRLVIDNKVEIKTSSDKIIVEGPSYYVKNMIRDINKRPSFWSKMSSNIVAAIIILGLVYILTIDGLGIDWKLKISRHNSFVENIEQIYINFGDKLGTNTQNANNYGMGVENEDYIFYVEDNLSLVRVDKNFQDKTYLIQESGGSNISRLNLLGKWIFYTRGQTINRIMLDGTQNEAIYESGYSLNMHLKGDWLYFINFSDGSNIYKMDINGRGLEKILDVDALDITFDDNYLIFSHKDEEEYYVEKMDILNSQRRVELKVLANTIVKWDEYYYFTGENYRLFKSKAGIEAEPQLLVDEEVSSYIITETGIFYSIFSGDVSYPGQKIFKIDLEGKNKALILDKTEIEGFTRIGDYVLFYFFDDDHVYKINKINIFTNIIEELSDHTNIEESHTPVINNRISIDYSGIEEFLIGLNQEQTTSLFNDIANGIYGDENYEDNLDSILLNSFMKKGIDISNNIDDVKSGLIITVKDME